MGVTLAKNAVYHGTLATTTVDKITLAAAVGSKVGVRNRGATDMYFTVDGATTPTVGGDDCQIVLAGAELVVPCKAAVWLLGSGNAYTLRAVDAAVGSRSYTGPETANAYPS